MCQPASRATEPTACGSIKPAASPCDRPRGTSFGGMAPTPPPACSPCRRRFAALAYSSSHSAATESRSGVIREYRPRRTRSARTDVLVPWACEIGGTSRRSARGWRSCRLWFELDDLSGASTASSAGSRQDRTDPGLRTDPPASRLSLRRPLGDPLRLRHLVQQSGRGSRPTRLPREEGELRHPRLSNACLSHQRRRRVLVGHIRGSRSLALLRPRLRPLRDLGKSFHPRRRLARYATTSPPRPRPRSARRLCQTHQVAPVGRRRSQRTCAQLLTRGARVGWRIAADEREGCSCLGALRRVLSSSADRARWCLP